VTREEKIAKARELRGQGLTAPEIAEVVHAPASTVRNWYLGGNCIDCGVPVDGGRGAGSSRRCSPCDFVARRVWTPERIIAAIQMWAQKYGSPPTACDWRVSPARRAEAFDRFQVGDWPCTKIVQIRFGSWSAGIRAAGFKPRSKGRPRRRAVAV
jgi:hypothetical protein